ncbi:NADH dehydrogenase subunit 6 (mitochondrion) [Danio rerio]|uniref:NADH-ubiquinone oxidoreductase chain 6 n=3 Tax=Danio TaxID=7954 RepID=NU6M_DANRE|nr:NADH dehydrogenase subunit 6 [Danio rerio]YP_009161782.1 NADH dehydrogenase subunit 6 [Danio nigrofasciatus]Q9MIX9.1 RecName: Full=NADH-ubiquinone oxidoreductase chain 6; AltName: Full=NADH dehydrogenase subunit 6 [Danio rerio]AAF74308.1 NADH dehydrogenase subunit 6 [Danio rerio]AIW65035.1 NADH dehydrogenase subunit 6 [Danio rerio]AKS28328.1 NADH dehydrogenase subunit 6 [Danio nigrofasciatus]ALK26785.1 NADH dehydrogenase subunit 6 [Danio rerio]ALK26811.1 NADH dehydrogenase subunit 6 [Dani|eukprot:NP_059342.1 NADH dehydrogenase subunit 6 (mitochondrion) [Danio rerio]
MAFYLSFLMAALVGGMIAIASNPAPYFAAFGLVVVAGVGCGILVSYGGSFLSLILFLIYLGGMLVVFAYSAALAAEPFPEAWGDRVVFWRVMVYGLVVIVAAGFLLTGDTGLLMSVDAFKEFSVIRADVSGVAMMYSSGGKMLVICAWVLLLTLFVVLEVTRGLSYGVLRAI